MTLLSNNNNKYEIVTLFLAHDELATCKASLVAPEQIDHFALCSGNALL